MPVFASLLNILPKARTGTVEGHGGVYESSHGNFRQDDDQGWCGNSKILSTPPTPLSSPQTEPSQPVIRKDFFGRLIEEPAPLRLSQMAPSQADRAEKRAKAFTRVVWYR